MKLVEFLDAIKNDSFVQAHEILEHDWKEIKKVDKQKGLFLKGLINGATALALIQKGKIDGAKRIWEAYLKYKVYQNLFEDDIINKIMEVLENKAIECKLI